MPIEGKGEGGEGRVGGEKQGDEKRAAILNTKCTPRIVTIHPCSMQFAAA